MAKDSRNGTSGDGLGAEEATSLETVIRQQARGLIDAIVEEELEAVLGAAPSARVGVVRQGYRHGTRERTFTTSFGPHGLCDAPGSGQDATRRGMEQSVVPRYQRRSERVDAAILGVYLSGTHTRRIKLKGR